MHGSMRGAERRGVLCLCSWVEAFVYRRVACCWETAQKLGSLDKHPGYVLNKLGGFDSSNPVYFTNTFLVRLDSLAGWEG